ncbi:DUF6807 family protein [bacterium RCC_150]
MTVGTRSDGDENRQNNERASKVALVGVHGFGAHHLENLERLQAAGEVELVAVADPNPPAPGSLPPDTAVFGNLEELLAEMPAIDLVIVATPIQTHAQLAAAALRRADLYLEKPPVPTLADFTALQDAAHESGRSVQVGFQSLGSRALQAIDELLASGEIGTLIGIAAVGRWVRERAYYKRSRWAGKRRLDGIDVVDGVASNPLAHAIATALRIAGARTLHDLASVETDLYRANDIEADDTSVIRIRTKAGLTISCALTLCASESKEPYVILQGSEGTAVFHYTEDRLSIRTDAGERHESFGRDDLTENLLKYLRRRRAGQSRPTDVELLSALSDSGAFMGVVEAIRTAPDPAQIPEEHIDWVGEGDSAHAVVRGIEDAIERATAAHATFKELGLPWARAGLEVAKLTLAVPDGGNPRDQGNGPGVVVTFQSGDGIADRLSPRPYLHPVRSVAGVTVTDHLPADHPWHLGAGIALQDVNGTNFWGGKTYTRSTHRYEEPPDHGRIVEMSATPGGGVVDQELTWLAPGGGVLLGERRSSRALRVADHIWRLDLTSKLTSAVDLSLGGPGSNGAAGSGYGGFFWRLPACRNPAVFTAEARGEAEVHGCIAPWLAFSADFPEGPATLVFAAPAEAPDPWFVRVSDYPGVGSAMVWDRPLQLAAGESVTRSLKVWIADGTLTAPEAAALA